jgi:hypothetical protein
MDSPMNLGKSAPPSNTLGAYTPDIFDPSTVSQLPSFSNKRLNEDTTKAERNPPAANEIHTTDFQAHISEPTSHGSMVSPLSMMFESH